MGLGAFAGRLLLASLFLLSGAMKIATHDQHGSPIVAYMTPKMNSALDRVQQLTGVRLPMHENTYPVLVLGAGCLELLGGILFSLGLKLGAFMLLVFLIPTTIVMHNFWDFESGTPGYQIEFINFEKNLCLFGAFLMYLSTPRQPQPPVAKLKAL